MKALVYTKANEVVFRQEPDPRPGPDDVLVKVEAVGICGSDMHAYHGHDPRRVPPLILGHEAAGVVVGGDLADRRVVINPLMTCGECAYCNDGRSNLCEQRELIGMRVPGAYAEYVAVAKRNLVPIPDNLSFEKATLVEPAATALHALNLARIRSARPLADLRCLVIGGGAVGMLCALLLNGYGARGVVVAETNPLRAESLREWVDCEVHDPLSDPLLADTAFDLVVDAVGSGATRKLASHAVAFGGILVHIGLMNSSEGLDIRKITLSEVSLIGVYCYTMIDFQATVQAISNGLPGTLDWLQTRPLAEGAQAFEDLDKGRIAAAKVILQP